jgi:serine/threonine-protein kinase
MSEPDELAARAGARVGTLLKDKWTIDSVLGIGGMATVYAGTHRNKKRVAIKMLHEELSLDARVRERFLQEGVAANTVGHRGAVEVFDEDVADGVAFLVMELLEGETLEARRARKGGRLPASQVLALVDQLLDVLQAAHGKGIVHRDLKPENLFYTSERVLKVLDFGIARVREGAQEAGSTRTRAGSVMGTPAFMAPEQARARWDLVDQQTDLWAVGATMFTLLTGRLVHEADTANEELALAITAPAPGLRTVLPDVPEGMAAFVDKALAYDKKDRWADATTMQSALRETYAEMQAAPSRASAAEIVPSAPLPTVSAPEGSADRSGAEADQAAALVEGHARGALTAPSISALGDATGSRTIEPAGASGLRGRAGVLVGVGAAACALVIVAVVSLRGGGSPPAPPTAGAEVAPTSATATAETPPVVAPSVTAIATAPQTAPSAPEATPSATPSAAASAPDPATPSATPTATPTATPSANDAPKPAPARVTKVPDRPATTAAATKPPPATPVKKADPFSRRD